MSTITGEIKINGTLNGEITIGGGESVNIQDNKTITPSGVQQVVTPDEGFDAMAQVTVGATPEELIDKLMYAFNGEFAYNMEEKGIGNIRCYGFNDKTLNVVLPNNITVIMANAFKGIDFIKTVVGLKARNIYESAFENCTSLVSARFSANNNNSFLKSKVFKGCTSLTDIYLGGFFNLDTGTDELLTGGSFLRVHVPSGRLSDFENDTNWQNMITTAASAGTTITLVGNYE